MEKPHTLEKDVEEQKRMEANRIEKPLTREQRRIQERVNKEAAQVFDQLTAKFFSFFIACEDPEGEEVKEKIKQVDAQWRVYCNKKRLLPKGYPMVKQYCENVIVDYKKNKEQIPQ